MESQYEKKGAIMNGDIPFHKGEVIPCVRAMEKRDCPKTHRWINESAAQHQAGVIWRWDLYGKQVILYTDPKRVEKVGIFATTPRNPYAFGYGPKVPTQYFVDYRLILGRAIRPRRVWMMQYGNSGSAWIDILGNVVFLDSDTEHRIQKMRDEGLYEA